LDFSTQGRTMDVPDGFLDAIGNTPLIRLRQAGQATGFYIYGKAEFLNPGGSVKDRAALSMVHDAEARGQLRPGGVTVEGTADNISIGLALVANALGYRTVIVIPDNQGQEKKNMLRLGGAELREVPLAPYRDPCNYVHVPARLAQELAESEEAGAAWEQFDNVVNRQGHYETTGPEIWALTDGTVDTFICSVGTGGTLGGMALAFKEHNAGVVIGLADPMGAALYSYYTDGELKPEGDPITEGIGQGRVTKNFEDVPVDEAFRITYADMLPVLFDLLRHEGLCLGGSPGINLLGAKRLAEKLDPATPSSPSSSIPEAAI